VQLKTTGSQVLFGLALVGTLATFAYMLTRPLERLIVIVPDDAFYYLTIARNIASSGLSSFDGQNPTNGYHPAWMFALTLCALVVSDPVTFLRVALGLAGLFHVLASIVLAKALAAWTGKETGRVGGALWLLNPIAINLALQGMEAAFYILALALAFWLYSVRLQPWLGSKTAPPASALASFGLLLSLCFLGRTEALILAAVAIAAMGLAFKRSFLRTTLITGLAFTAGVVPWFLYSRLATGTWFQRSGSMKLVWAAESGLTLFERLTAAFKYLFGGWITYPVLGIPGGGLFSVRLWTGLVITLALSALLWRGLKREATADAARVGLVVLLGSMLTGGIYGTFFSDTQYWYKAQPGLIFFVLTFGCAALVIRAIRPTLARGAAVAAALLTVPLLIGRLATLNSYPHQRDVLLSQRRFDDMVPAGATIGCFNAGIPGYFGKRRIVNLDGLVNNTIYDYYVTRTVDVYLERAEIGYVADEMDALERGMRFFRSRPELDVVASAAMPGWTSGRRYLWRIGRESRPQASPTVARDE
jgi:hypothetical protein